MIGKFQISVKSNTKYYITQAIGSCESSKTEVDINVGLSALNIANTFTPNSDGVNDTWTLKGIENYPASLVQLFNRYGQKVFESKGYTSAFDGNFNGQRLSAGTYYYIINLSSACNLISGDLTLIR
ncbi:MAG: gliding motility-associated C-terminal domain-containing protein [Sphingobacteriaceae bacterium]|nr:MAG: gliding motility-associated C-terminal domain-containing protein [Sphingobacteriaceae bacterium]